MLSSGSPRTKNNTIIPINGSRAIGAEVCEGSETQSHRTRDGASRAPTAGAGGDAPVWFRPRAPLTVEITPDYIGLRLQSPLTDLGLAFL